MRRHLLVFLLFVLPCQWLWAAAVPYCMHETQKAAWHLGHHEHRHDAGNDAVKKNEVRKDSTKVVIDADCDVCHLASAPLASVARTFVSIHERVPAPVPSFERKLRSYVPEAPDRPNWSRLA